MRYLIIFLALLLSVGFIYAQQASYTIEVGPELNFTQAQKKQTTSAKTSGVTVKSFMFGAELQRKVNQFLSLGVAYAFGRGIYRHSNFFNVHKYSLLGTVNLPRISFSVVGEYIYADAPGLSFSGSGLGVKILYLLSPHGHLAVAAAANIKNQSLGLAYTF